MTYSTQNTLENQFNLKRIKGIIFDCDGVMIDSLDANRHFYNLILKYAGLPPITEEQEKFAFQSTALQALQMMMPKEFHNKLEEFVAKAVDYPKDILPKIKLMPGFFDFIVKAKSLGIKMAVDTNRTDYGIERVLNFFNLQTYFSPVVSSTGINPKPDPEGAIFICEKWKVDSRDVLFIGDNRDDGVAAKGAGTIFVAFKNNEINGDIHIKDFQSLGEMLFPNFRR